MSRTGRYVAALSTGYIALVVNVICVGVSIPMALHFLDRQEFGLWSVVLQITGYLALLDLGIGQSVARLLVDSKDDVNGGTYGSILKLAALVFAVQASLIALFGLTCGQFVADLMRIPPALSATFRNLMLGQCLMMAFNFIVTPINLPLWSHQRVDIGNINNVVSFLVNLLFLWLGFVLGLRTYSLLLAYTVSSLVTFILNTNSSLRLKLLPDAGHWGKLDRKHVFEVFAFGRDLFITNLAGQLISASQIVLVSRFVSLDAAAIWAVCMKSYSMAQQLIFRLSDFSAPGFSEMVVRGEVDRFRSRVMVVTAISATGAGFFGVLGAFGNSGFVSLWTGGKVSWSTWSDIFAAAYLISTCTTRCYTTLVGIIKKIGNYKYVSLLEGVMVVAGGIVLAPKLHFVGVLLSSLVANLLCSGLYGMIRVANYFRISLFEVSFRWLRFAVTFIVSFSLVATAIFLFGDHLGGRIAFLASCAAAGIAGAILAVLVGLPPTVRTELGSLLLRVRSSHKPEPKNKLGDLEELPVGESDGQSR